MKIEMKDLQKALAALRSIEQYEPAKDNDGALGALRAKAFCARIAIETSIGTETVEVQS